MSADKHHHSDPAEAVRELLEERQKQAQQTPSWPGAKEEAQPQHAQPHTTSGPAPRDIEKTPPSESGYERNDINKRHH